MIVALSGGIGGAKLVLGLSRVLPPGALTVIANPGDDFEHLGLAISPDLDTLAYTLAGLDNKETGWGRRDETWSFMEALAELGGETWFRLGDRDLALHVERTRRLRAGEPLSAITADVCRRWGIATRLLPATDDPVRTRLDTDLGWMDFQPWFVGRRAEPAVRAVAFAGAAEARPLDAALAAIAAASAVVICPSNPLISIEPILAIPAFETMLRTAKPVIAVSPIIAGRAVKGPTAKMMADLGMRPGARAVAELYGELLDVFVADPADAGELAGLGVPRRDRADVDGHAGGEGGVGAGGARRGAAMTSNVWAAVPVKALAEAKQRLAPLLAADQRAALARAMVEDVLETLAAAPLAGIMVSTLDADAAMLARRYGARVVTEGAGDGQTGAVTAMARILAAEGCAMLTCPGDIPRISVEEVAALLAAHRRAPAATMAPAHDRRGSNAILLSPADVMPLRFGDDSFLPHLATARRHGLDPVVLELPGIGLDIDNPADALALLRAMPPRPTRAVAVLRGFMAGAGG